MNEDIVAIAGFFITVIALGLGIPLVRAVARQAEARAKSFDPRLDERLARIETAIEAMAVEVERISEGQRFVTKLMAEREKATAALPQGEQR